MSSSEIQNKATERQALTLRIDCYVTKDPVFLSGGTPTANRPLRNALARVPNWQVRCPSETSLETTSAWSHPSSVLMVQPGNTVGRLPVSGVSTTPCLGGRTKGDRGRDARGFHRRDRLPCLAGQPRAPCIGPLRYRAFEDSGTPPSKILVCGTLKSSWYCGSQDCLPYLRFLFPC